MAHQWWWCNVTRLTCAWTELNSVLCPIALMVREHDRLRERVAWLTEAEQNLRAANAANYECLQKAKAERDLLLCVAAEGVYRGWDQLDSTAAFGDPPRIRETMVARVRVELKIARQGPSGGLPGLMLEVVQEVLAEVMAKREQEGEVPQCHE